MRLSWRFVACALCLFLWMMIPSIAFAYPEQIEELWRSRFGHLPITYNEYGLIIGSDGLATDASNGSLWVIEGATVTHLAITGELVGRSPALFDATTLAVDSGNGTCWVLFGGYEDKQVGHLAPNGRLFSTTPIENCQELYPSPYDGSLWAVGYSGYEYVLVHISSEGVMLSFEGRASQVAVDPNDGSVWKVFYIDGEGIVVRCTSDNTEMWRVTLPALVMSIHEEVADQSVWLVCHGLSGYTEVHLSATGEILSQDPRAGDTAADTQSDRAISFPYLYVSVYSPFDDTYWGLGNSADGTTYLFHLAQDDTPLYESPRWTYYTSLGHTFDPQDGSFWVMDSYRDYVHLSAQGEEVERRVDAVGLYRDDDAMVSPYDGSWWVLCAISSSRAYFRHLSAEGTELSRLEGYNYFNRMTIDPQDGSLWVVGSGLTSELEWFRVLQRVDATGVVKWTRTFDIYTEVSGPFLEPDGSAWVLVSSDTGAIREHISADGAVVGYYPVAPEMINSPMPEAQLSCFREWTQTAEGKLYVLITVCIDGHDQRGWIRCFSHEGTLLWERSDAFSFNNLAVDPQDQSIWVAMNWRSGGQTDPATVIHYSADGAVLWMGGVFENPSMIGVNAADGTAWVVDADTGQVIHLGLAPSPFTDISKDFWAYDAIVAGHEAGIFPGYSDGTFRPKLEVHRDQMATFIARAMCGGEAFVPSGPATASFPDVPVGAWGYQHIEYCKAQKIVQGYWDGYHPERTVKRDQLAVYIARTQAPEAERPDLPSYTPPSLPSFLDIPTSFWAYKFIEYCYENGIVEGYWDGYHPERVVLRDQMAVYIARAFGLL